MKPLKATLRRWPAVAPAPPTPHHRYTHSPCICTINMSPQTADARSDTDLSNELLD